jgi:hypothetical protein
VALGVGSRRVVAVVATVHRCWGDGAGDGGCSRCKQPHLDGEEGCARASYVVVVVDKLKITKKQLVFEKRKKRTIKHLIYMRRGLRPLPAT